MTDAAPGPGAEFRILGERELYRGRFITLVEAGFQAPDGTAMTRDVVHHPGAVSVVPVDGDEVVLVRQFRAPIGKSLLEIPAGLRDVPGERPETTAARELAEEAGFEAAELTLVSRFHNSAGFTDETSYVYLATDLTPVTTDRQGVEEQWMTVERVGLDDVADLIASGGIEDAKTLIGLLLALRHLGR